MSTADQSRTDADRTPTKVLVAVDGSDTSLRAAKVAHQMFGDDAKYVVVNVGTTEIHMWSGDPMTWGVPYPLVLAEVGANGAPFHAEATFDNEVSSVIDRAQDEARAVSSAAELPSDAVALGVTGDPVAQIRQVADDESIDVVVVGSGSGGWWRHLFDPSVSKAIVRHADRPVLVVP